VVNRHSCLEAAVMHSISITENNYKQVAPNGASESCPCAKSPVREELIVEHNPAT